MRIGFVFRQFCRLTQTTGLFLFFLLGLGNYAAYAACQMVGNNLVCDCDGTTVDEKLCRGTGNACSSPALVAFNPASASNSPQDNLVFNIPVGGATIDYTITSPDVGALVPGETQLVGDGAVDNPNPGPPADQPFSATIGGASVPISTTVSAAGNFSPKVELNNFGGGPSANLFRFVTYSFKCTPTKGTLKIDKVSIGGTDTFPIVATPLVGSAVNYSVTTTGSPNGTGTQSQDVAPETYKITETPPSGWLLDSIVCSGNGSSGDSAIVRANTTTTCTVTNKKKASVTINKKTLGGTGAFKFDATTVPAGQSAIAQFTETTAAQNVASTGTSLTNLVPGDYTFTETPPAGTWLLTDLTCDQGTGITSPSTSGLAGSFTLAPGATGTCTFTNTFVPPNLGTIIIEKIASGGDGVTPFNFTTVGAGLSGFSLTPPANGPAPIPKTFTNLAPGNNYSITETPVANWTTTLSCVDPSGGTTTVGATATIGLAAGETVTCTYTNTRNKADLTIEKQTIGGNGSFSFNVAGQGSFSLSGGQSNTLALPTGLTYTITETNLPAGWTLQSISNCGKIDLANKSVSVLLTDAGAHCIFTNFKKKDDKMEEETRRFIHRRVDNLLTYGPDRARMLRRLQEQPPQQSLKDGPLKLAGDMGTASTMLGRSPMGLGAGAQSGPAIGFGSSMSMGVGMPSSQLAHGYESPFRYDGVIVKDETEQDLGFYAASPATPSILGQIANQLTPLAGGQTSFKFGTSLSELRAMAAAAEEANQRKKLEDAGLGLTDQPYMANPYLTMRQGLDVWVEGQIAKYDDDIGGVSREGDFSILYVGADYVLAPGILVGALVQIDDTDEDIDDPTLSGDIEGTGWMAGPYVGIRLADNLFFDARAAWGQSDNDINLTDGVSGPRRGSFDTDRWLASASLTGSEYFGAWRLSPQLQVAYGNEESDAYTNSLGQTVASTEATIGRLTGTVEVGYRIETGDGTIVEPHASIAGIWNFDTDELSINGVLQEPDEARAKLEGGVLIRTPAGWGVRAAGAYDGIGSGDYDAYSGSLWVNVPLN